MAHCRLFFSLSSLASNTPLHSYSWNVHGNGLNTEPGPEGPVCKVPRGINDLYVCYNSCLRSKPGCSMRNGCNSASCMDDVGFIKELVDHLVATLCVNLDQIHLTGISAGAIMVYGDIYPPSPPPSLSLGSPSFPATL